MKIRPLYDRIVVKRATKEEKTAGGIIVPESVSKENKSLRGVVISTGKGRITDKGERLNMKVKTGDKVIFGKFAGSEVAINNQDLLVMKETDILGILEGE